MPSEAIESMLEVLERRRVEKLQTPASDRVEFWECSVHGVLNGPEEYLVHAARCDRHAIPVDSRVYSRPPRGRSNRARLSNYPIEP